MKILKGSIYCIFLESKLQEIGFHGFNFDIRENFNTFMLNQIENPALPKVLIVTPGVFPCLVVNYDFSYNFPYKPTQLRISKPS